MHGKFDDNMSFTGAALTVCGPILWNGTVPTDLPATHITLLFVCVWQPTGAHGFVVAPASAGFDPPPAGTNEWMADVSGKWVAGPASALAYVKVAIAGRARDWIFETWSESITIFEA